MKAMETSLRGLLEGTKQYQMPLFQRPYSWEKKNWETLWDDIIKIYKGEIEGFYFLGPVVTQSIPGTAEGISPFVVIDGQQRLTTLSLLLIALRNYLKKNDAPERADEIHELYLINKFKKGDNLYKVLPTYLDRDLYKTIIDRTQKDCFKGDEKINKAYQFFEKIIEQQKKEIDCEKIITVILEKIVLVSITSEEHDNPYLIFESLNYKGQDLTQADLVRNYIFMRLPHEQQKEIYDKLWFPLQNKFKEHFGDSNYSKKLTEAFWYYLRKDGLSVPHKNVYQTLQNKIDNSTLNIIDELKELTKFTKYYERLTFPDEEFNSLLKSWFQRFMRFDFTTSHIFLLNVYDLYEQERLSIDDFQKILIYLESYFVRRLFSGVSTRVLGNVFNSLYNQANEKNPDNLVDGLYQVLKSFEGNKIWPTDEEFRKGIINKPIYTTKSSSDRAKLILERIEKSRSKELVNPEDLTIEHIMPQTLNKEWKLILGKDAINLHKHWIHTLGNLTLTGYNSELSNKPWSEKIDYFNDSNLKLNRYFRTLKSWDFDEIKRRAEYLADIAVKVWPR